MATSGSVVACRDPNVLETVLPVDGHKRIALVLGRGVQGSAFHGLGHHLIEARLDDGTRSPRDHVDLGAVRIDTPYLVTIGRQAGGRHRPDVSQPEHCNPHRAATPQGEGGASAPVIPLTDLR